MADLTQTAANVKIGAGAVVEAVTCGETVTQGQPAYKKSADNEHYKADASTEAEAEAVGIFVTPNVDGQPALIQKSGQIDLGATLVVGEVYVVSATAGGIAPESDLGSGHFPTVLGIAISTSLLQLNIQAGGVAKP